jgi:exodeoxyribonuclease V gamma subunit
MALHLYRSNKLEILVTQLAQLLQERPALPMLPETIVVQHQGMGQWVRRQLAQRLNIAANLKFPLPGRFIGELMEQLLGQQQELQLFGREVLTWRLYQLLPEFSQNEQGVALKKYTQSENTPLKPYQLASILSNLFDQYQIFRPDILRKWEQEPSEEWQSALWYRLSQNLADRSTLLHRTLETLNAVPFEHCLPKQIYLFGINSMAPIYLDIIQTLANHSDIHLLTLSPCQEYWGDVLSDRQLSRSKKFSSTAPETMEELYISRGNPLLASLGSVGQDFHNQLLEYTLEEFELFEPWGDNSILHLLHDHILEMEDISQTPESQKPLLTADGSLQFHVCHSPLREVQVLHDRLLDLFQQLPKLNAGDILVVTPDIQVYSQAIEGVFNSCPPEHFIPFMLSDQVHQQLSPTIQTFADLLSALSGTFGVAEILNLLEADALLSRFKMESTDIPKIRLWIEDTAIHWGLDEGQRASLGIPEFSQNSWQDGCDKLLLSYFLGSNDIEFQGSYGASSIAVSESELLGGLTTFISQLRRWASRIKQAKTLSDWAKLLLMLVEDFFDQETDPIGVNLVREILVKLDEQANLAACALPIDYQVVAHHLTQTLGEGNTDQVFLSGRVTFCNMVPMRSVPFRVICLLGMQDGNFPRSQPAISFNLMQQQPRIGDRNRRADDRYLFLETLLSAQDCLYISWIGRSQLDNSESPPSSVVSELHDYLNQCFQTVDGTIPAKLITCHHPLQPFSPENYVPLTNHPSFAANWLPTLHQQPAPPFITDRLAVESVAPKEPVALEQFIRFWMHPCRYFLEQQLGLRMGQRYRLLEESEAFDLDGLQQYSIRRQILELLLDDQPEDQITARLRSSGQVPLGEHGTIQLEQQFKECRECAEILRPKLSKALPPYEINLKIGQHHLTGWLDDLYATQGRIDWSVGRITAHAMMTTWICHLILCLQERPPAPKCSAYHGREEQLFLNKVNEPEPYLVRLLDLYQEGQTRPLPFFPATCLARATAKPGKENDEARKAWQSSRFHRGEEQDAAYQLLYRSQAGLPIYLPEAITLAELFLPLFAHRTEDAEA